MFEYTCSKANLINLLYDVTYHGKEAIFPQRKDWKFLIKRVYPKDHKVGHFVVLLICNQECIVFIPVEKKIDPCLLSNIKQTKDRKWFTKGLPDKIEKFQQICITSERYKEEILQQIKNKEEGTSLLVLGAKGLFFAQGSFQNQRLNYRLEQLHIDVERNPVLFAEEGAELSEPLTVSLFYQSIFQTLTHLKYGGLREVSLQEVLSESSMFYPLYTKIERRELRLKVKEHLQVVFEAFFKGTLIIKEKQVGVEQVFMVQISQIIGEMLTANQWSRAMKQSLVSLSREEMQTFEIELV